MQNKHCHSVTIFINNKGLLNRKWENVSIIIYMYPVQGECYMLKSISYCMSAQVTWWSKAYDMDFTIILFISSSESKDQVRFSDPDLSVIHCCCKLLTIFTSSSEPLSLNFWKGVNVFLLLCWKRMWFHFKKLDTKHPWVKRIQVVTNE